MHPLEPPPAQPPTRKKRVNNPGGHPGTMKEMGGIPLPVCPDTADELAGMWQVGSGEAPTLSVKVLRQRIGSREVDLIDSVPLVHFNMRTLAGKYGPGLYYLRGSGSKIAQKSAKMNISDEYAREAGFGRIIRPEPPPQVPTASDMVAMQTLQQVGHAGGMSPEQIISAIEQAVTRISERNGVGPRPIFDPVEESRKQMEAVERQMDFFARMEARVRATIVAKEEPAEVAEEFSLASIFKALAPSIPAIIAGFRQPQPPPYQPARAKDVTPPQEEKQMNLPELSQEEKQAIAPAVSMLRPFVGMLSSAIKNTGTPDEAIARQLGGFIPPNLYDSTIALCALVETRGPEVLGHIAPGLVDPRWSPVLRIMRRELNAVLSQDGEG